MIYISDIFLKYGDRVLFDNISFSIGLNDKIGLTGRNGAGKSTLLKIIASEQSPDDGKVNLPTNATIGYLHQDMDIPQDKTVREECNSAFEEIKVMEAKLEKMHEEIGHRTDYESDSYATLLNEYSELNEHLALMGSQNIEATIEKVLKGLGFKLTDFDRPTKEFSGGWQMRIELAKILLRRPSFLLLDEPTNHLDIESILWLESFLKNYEGAVIIISHDRQFLNNVTKRTVEIELGKIYDYKAPYDKYLEMRLERKEKQMAAFVNQQKVLAQKERTIERFMAKATKTKMAQSMQKQLDKVNRIEVDQSDNKGMNIRFAPSPRSGQIVVEAKAVSKSYGALKVLNGVSFQLERGERIAFVGQNGQGKTTLAKMIVKELEYESGDLKLGHNVKIGYYAQNQAERLNPKATLLETMEEHSPPEMRTKLRSILGAFLFSGEDVDKKVSVLSGGERARLSMACLLLNPFNLLVLDEPTNHLDIISKEILKEAIADYDGALIIVSHDRDFLGGLTEKTIEFRDKKLHTHLGDVNYFLKKRALDNMRAVEMSTAKAKETSEEAPKEELSYEERKKRMRRLSTAEKKIERIEEQIAEIELKMADPSFYGDANAQVVMKDHAQLKRDLEGAMEEWEEASMEIDGL